MRARARAAADRRRQRARVDVLLQTGDHGERARGARVTGGGREARAFLCQKLVVRPRRPRGRRRAAVATMAISKAAAAPCLSYGRRDYSEFQRLPPGRRGL